MINDFLDAVALKFQTHKIILPEFVHLSVYVLEIFNRCLGEKTGRLKDGENAHKPVLWTNLCHCAFSLEMFGEFSLFNQDITSIHAK